MASRRKQTKPKAFGLTEEEELLQQQLQLQQPQVDGSNLNQTENLNKINETIQNTLTENQNENTIINNINDKKRKRDDLESDEVDANAFADNVSSEINQTSNNFQNNSDDLNINELPNNKKMFIPDLISGEHNESQLVEEEDGIQSEELSNFNSNTNLGYGMMSSLGDELDDVDEEEDDELEEGEEDDEDLIGDDGEILSNHSEYNDISSSYAFNSQNGSMMNESDMYDQNGARMDANGKQMLLMFKCKVCGKTFKHRRSLNRHVKLHSGEKNFKCPYCTTAFARSDHLKAHIRTHNNSKPFKCSVCQCGYSSQAALKVHMAHHHTKSKFRCNLCNDMEFHSQLALEGHIYTMHSKENAKASLDDLINESTYIPPTLVSIDELNAANNTNQSTANSQNNTSLNMNNHNNTNEINSQASQRSRLIDINNYPASVTNQNDSACGRSNNFTSNENQYPNLTKSLNSNNNNNNSMQFKAVNNYEHVNNNNNNNNQKMNESYQNGFENIINENNKKNLSNNNLNEDDDDDIIFEEEQNTNNIMPNNMYNASNPNFQDPRFINIAPKAPIIENNYHNNNNNNQYPHSQMMNGHMHPNSQYQPSQPPHVPRMSISMNRPPGPPGPPPSSSHMPYHHPHPNSQQGPPNNMNMPRHLQQPPPPLPSSHMNMNHPSRLGPPQNQFRPPYHPMNSSYPNGNMLPHPHQMHHHHRPPPPPPLQNMQNNPNQSQPNTYCELCNARFSNIESYSAHMRNCHPNIQQKMPYLTSVLNGPSSKIMPPQMSATNSPVQNGILCSKAIPPSGTSPSITQVTPVVRSSLPPPTHLNHNVQPSGPNPPPPPPPPPPPTMQCNVPSCNCSMKSSAQPPFHSQSRTILSNYLSSDLNGKPNSHFNNNGLNSDHLMDDFFIVKETCFTCVQCNLTLYKQSDYMTHLKQEHCVEVYRCVLCKQMQLFDNLNLLKEHFFQQHSAHKYDTFKCKLCLQTQKQVQFQYAEDLCMHLKNVHNKFVDINRLRSSFTSSPNDPRSAQYAPRVPPVAPPPPPAHMPTKCYKCSHCDSDFAQLNSLNQHIQIVHQNLAQQQQQQFSCQYCRNTFSQKAQLERHLRIHLSTIDLKCNICDKQFENQDTLNEHKLTHSKSVSTLSNTAENGLNNSSSSISSPNKIDPSCSFCNQAIQNDIQFKQHFKLHNDIDKKNQANTTTTPQTKLTYLCPVCRQVLTSNQEYLLHMKHHLRKSNAQQQQQNNDQKTQEECMKFLLKCSKCPVKFEYGQDYVDHLRKDHPNEFSNVECLTSPSRCSYSATSSSTTSSYLTAFIPKPSSIQQQQQTPSSQTVKEERKSPVNISTTATKTINTPISNSNNSQSVPNNMNFTQQVPQFMCEICSSKFDSAIKLHSHLLYKHEFSNQQQSNQMFSCPVCDESHSRPELLLQHVHVHGQAAKIYKCTVCPSSFVFKSQLINHSFSHQQHSHVKQSSQQQQQQLPRPTQTTQMASQPASQNYNFNMNRPMPSSHTNQSNMQRVQSNNSLNSNPMPNMNQNTNNNNINNRWVNNSMNQSLNNSHNNNNNHFNDDLEPLTPNQYIVNDNPIDGTKTYTCLTCSKIFTNQRNLTVHMRIHTGFRPFECNICKRTFTSNANSIFL